MQRNMHEWRDALLRAEAKKPMPILSFPGAALLGISVKELLFSAENQADAMAAVAARTDSAASVSLMDLSVEAECFGAPVHVSEDEVPTVTGRVIHSPADAALPARAPPAAAGGQQKPVLPKDGEKVLPVGAVDPAPPRAADHRYPHSPLLAAEKPKKQKKQLCASCFLSKTFLRRNKNAPSPPRSPRPKCRRPRRSHRQTPA